MLKSDWTAFTCLPPTFSNHFYWKKIMLTLKYQDLNAFRGNPENHWAKRVFFSRRLDEPCFLSFIPGLGFCVYGSNNRNGFSFGLGIYGVIGSYQRLFLHIFNWKENHEYFKTFASKNWSPFNWSISNVEQISLHIRIKTFTYYFTNDLTFMA